MAAVAGAPVEKNKFNKIYSKLLMTGNNRVDAMLQYALVAIQSDCAQDRRILLEQYVL